MEPPDTPVAPDATAASRGGASLLVLQTFGRVLGLVFVMVLTRQLDPANVGRYSTAAAVVLFANLIADFGTSPAITRLVSRDRRESKTLLSGTLVASFLFGTVVAAAIVIFGVTVYDGPVSVDIAVASLAIPAASVLSSLLGALDGAGLIARRAVVTAIQTLVVAFGAIPVLAGADVRAAVIALAVAPWVALAVAACVTRAAGLCEPDLRLDPAETGRLLRMALPFALSGGLSALVLRFDVIFLSVVRTPAETASYDLALRLLEATTYASTAIGGPLLFILSRRLGQGDREGAARAYGEALRLLYAIGLPLSVGLATLAHPLVVTALGPGFGAVATPLIIMGAAQWLTFVVMVQGTLVMSGDVVGRGIAVGGVIAAVTIGLDVVLVPLYGANGAAAAMVASWVFAAGLLDAFHRRTVGIATPLPSPGLLTASAAMGLVVFLLSGSPLVVAVIAGAFAYGAVVFLTGAVTPGDVARFRRALSGQSA